jgi:hypothetical protein
MAHINSIFLENNSKNPRIHWALYFCRKAPVEYFIYDLVPIILHIGPYLSFHNYD